MVLLVINYEEYTDNHTSVEVRYGGLKSTYATSDVVGDFNDAVTEAVELVKSSGEDLIFSSTVENFLMDNDTFYELAYSETGIPALRRKLALAA